MKFALNLWKLFSIFRIYFLNNIKKTQYMDIIVSQQQKHNCIV